ncbi:GDSL-type esterase/lipase family protein [Bacillus solitudinis]|uniref:GDSL-type esterase/lipase family protein n=1 Tax=Bacillus solitudinis TaxID=2014074 RepID=UPI0018E25DB6|nr:GDSL-type esterase/lipase family protein [Bacillus solitudinis]
MSDKQWFEMLENPVANEVMQAFFKFQKEEKLTRYKHLNQKVRSGQILFVGSSLMEHFPINELQQTLEDRYIIYNRGVGGFLTTELLSHMETCIFALEPSKVFINIGSNDIGSPDYKRENLIVNYEKILQQIKERLPRCMVYVMAYYPVNAEVHKTTNENLNKELFKTRNNPNFLEANKSLAILAEKHGYEFINVNEGLVDSAGNLKENFTVEGFHMWPNAYSVVFKNLLKYL